MRRSCATPETGAIVGRGAQGRWANPPGSTSGGAGPMRNTDMPRRGLAGGAPAVAAALILVGAALPAVRAQESSLWTVLTRATRHVEALHAHLSGVVMEERYEQRATAPAAFRRSGDGALERVTLRSDYLLVRPEGSARHFGFRDVFEANGARVRDRDDRLARLFLGGATSLSAQVQRILAESARYNVGDVQRTLNTPTLPLLFLRNSHKARFEFARAEDAAPDLGIGAPDRGAGGLWVIACRETGPRTVIRRRDGTGLPARGRYWIEPDTGRVLVTELVVEDENVDALVGVRYAIPEALDHLAPVEMRERYHNHHSRSQVEGAATYGRFRRFRVVVEESEPVRD